MKQQMQESSLKRAREAHAFHQGGMSAMKAIKKANSSLGSYYTAKRMGLLESKPEQIMTDVPEKMPMAVNPGNNKAETLVKMILIGSAPDSEKVQLLRLLLIQVP